MVKIVKPSIALILIRAEWFSTVIALPAIEEGTQEDANVLINTLSTYIEIDYQWQVNSIGSLQACIQGLRTAEFDLAVICFQVWAEDFFLKPLVDALAGQPLAVWCYQPASHPPRPMPFVDVLRFSGPVGTLEGLGTLRNLGVDYHFIIGAPDNPRLVQELYVLAKVMNVRRLLKTAHFGLLPAHNEQMQSTFVDEINLHAQIGPLIEYLSVSELARLSEELVKEEIDSYLNNLRQSYRIEGVSDKTLERAARASLALAHLAVNHNLDVISLNDTDDELHRVLGLRPCLYPPLLDQARIMCGLEGDLGAATAMFILNLLTSSPCFFVEFWFWDEATNQMVGGHAGMQNPAIAGPDEPWISRDYEYAQSDPCEGTQFQFVAHPGRVTLLQMRATPTGWQAIAAVGEALDLPAWIEGYPHVILHPDVAVVQFFRQAAKVGTTQHWIMAYGEVLTEVEILCRMLGVELKII